jgi:TRAP-type C4-dicarboxylate transport system permease small subunit
MTALLPPAPPEPAPLRWLGTAVDWAIVALGAALVVIVFANVVMHQLDVDIAWTTEFGEFVMVWTSFLGAAAATRRRGHMAITELRDLAGGAGGRALRLAIELTVAAVLAILLWYGIVIVRASWGNILTVLDWPMAWQYMALPVGSAIALVYVLRDLVVLARGGTLEPAPENAP